MGAFARRRAELGAFSRLHTLMHAPAAFIGRGCQKVTVLKVGTRDVTGITTLLLASTG